MHVKYVILLPIALGLSICVAFAVGTLPVSTDGAFFGVALMVFGVFNWWSRKIIAQNIAESRLGKLWFWSILGRDGVEFLYFEIGFILFASGLVQLARVWIACD